MNYVPERIGIIGGSGIYDIAGLTNKRWEKVTSPFGEPSSELLFGELDGHNIVFLPRHGRGHRIPPTEINFHANIDALKRVGVTDVISVSAVGSLREDLPPGTFVIIDQFIDRTFARNKSFFGTGLVAHVSMAYPVCKRLGDHIEMAAKEANIPIVRGGTYLVMEGPQFSSHVGWARFCAHVENLTVAEGGNRIADTIYVSPGCACCLPKNDDPLHGCKFKMITDSHDPCTRKNRHHRRQRDLRH
jgi:purine nucleoside phosphorylase